MFFLEAMMMERVWGGNRLAALYGKSVPAGKVIGESWELSDREEAQSRVAAGAGAGAWAGVTLRNLLRREARGVWGAWDAPPPERFPLLVKYVDAAAPLSVQVHPDDALARQFNDSGKSECWIVVHAEPGAKIVRGLRPGTTRAEFIRALDGERVEELLHSFTPKVGDVVALPAGTIHAIGAGLVVAEIQQNSDLTFRLYDYKRLGLDGKPRKLHREEALASIRFDGFGDQIAGDMSRDTVAPLSCRDEDGVRCERLLTGQYFSLERFTLPPGRAWTLAPHPPAPRVLMALAGAGTLNGAPLRAGQTLLIPAAAGEIKCAALGNEPLVLALSAPLS